MSSAPLLSAVPNAGLVPRHVAIIMDGNGRWAKARHLPRVAGHKAGVEAVRRVTRAARAMGIEALTLYAFSSENWRRPAEEIGDLMGLLKFFIRNDLAELVRKGRITFETGLDKAHHVEDSATEYFGAEASQLGALALLGRFLRVERGDGDEVLLLDGVVTAPRQQLPELTTL